MPKRSAGILLHRTGAEGLEVLVAHPGGPLWARKDLGAWTLPKGEIDPDEPPRHTALREFAEELGSPAPGTAEDLVSLGEVVQSGGKIVVGYALAGTLDAEAVVSNTFQMVWPPRSGREQEFPEIDRAAWVSPARARELLNPAQVAFVDRLEEILAGDNLAGGG